MQTIDAAYLTNLIATQSSWNFGDKEGSITPEYTARAGTLAGRNSTSVADDFDDVGEQIAALLIDQNVKAYVSESTSDERRYELYKWFYDEEADSFGRTFDECLFAANAYDAYDKILEKIESLVSDRWMMTLRLKLKTGLGYTASLF